MENKEKYKDMNWKDIRTDFNETESLEGKFNILNDVVIQKGLLLSLTTLSTIKRSTYLIFELDFLGFFTISTIF